MQEMSAVATTRNPDPKFGPKGGVEAVGKSGKRKAGASAHDKSPKRRKFIKGGEENKVQHTDKPQSSAKDDSISTAKRRAERKAERRDVLTRAREKWEELRPKATAKDKAVKLCDDLYKDLCGRIREFAFRPDGSRIIQWLLASSSPSTSSAVVTELIDASNNVNVTSGGQGEASNTSFLAKLLTDRYGKHLAIKLLRLVPASKRMELMKIQVIPYVSALMRTVPGVTALDVAYTTLLNGPSRSQLVLAILFSTQVVHWQQVQRTLVDTSANNMANSEKSSVFTRALECVPGEFRQVILDSAYETASRLVEKEELLSLELVHAVLREWLDVAMMGDNVENVKALASALATHIGRLCHTRAGMLVSLNVIKVLDAKHRKKAARSLPGLLRKMVVDEFGHRVVLGLMEWTDDTRLVGQLLVGDLFKGESKVSNPGHVENSAETRSGESRSAVVAERKRGGRSKAEKKGKKTKECGNVLDKSSEEGFDIESMVNLFKHKFGRMIFLNVLFGHDSRYFNPEGYGIVWKGIDENKFGKTSKKDGEVRRQELLGYMEEGIKVVVLQHARILLENLQASPVVVGAAMHGGTRDAVILVVKEMFEHGSVEEICKSASARRALGTIFKVSKDVATEVVTTFGSDAVRTLAATDYGKSVAKHLANGCGDVSAVALLEKVIGVGTGFLEQAIGVGTGGSGSTK